MPPNDLEILKVLVTVNDGEIAAAQTALGAAKAPSVVDFMVRTMDPYYRSTFAFVSRRDAIAAFRI